MMKPFSLLKKAARRLLPYSPRRGILPLALPNPGTEREGVSRTQVFPPGSFRLREYRSLAGSSDFIPYSISVPAYELFSLKGGIFISGREEVFSRKGRIIERITAQKVNPLSGKRIDLRTRTRIRARVLLLGMSGLEDGYYHFLIELLLRWWIFKRSGLEADYYAFSTEMPFQREALSLLGIREGQMLEVESGRVVQASLLLCPSLVNNFELSHLRGHELYNKLYMPSWSHEAYSFLKKRNAMGGERAEKLIYISRNRSPRRRIENEEELLPILERYGFERHYLEEMDLPSQAALFAAARMVVAPHGAGLANLVWSREGTTVLELYPEFYHDPSFRILASSCGLDYHYLICKSPGADDVPPPAEGIFIDRLDLIEDFLREKVGIR